MKLTAEIGWRAGESFSRYLLADCLAWRGEYRRALRIARESLAIAQEIEHLEWQAGARRVLGVIALYLFSPGEALAQLEEAHDIAKRLGSAAWTRWTGAPLVIALARSNDLARATALIDSIDASVGLACTTAERSNSTRATLGSRYIDIARGELALARGDAEGALLAVKELGDSGVPRVEYLRAQALALQERWAEATAVLAVARDDAMAQEARSLLWRIDALQGEVYLGERRRTDARRSFDSARAIAAELASELDEPSLVAAFRAGVDGAAPPPAERTAKQEAKAAHGGLTRRERDTAALIAQGKSNRAIARALGIGERTVEGYVASALSKLGVSSRAQIAVWAAEQGLAGGTERSRH